MIQTPPNAASRHQCLVYAGSPSQHLRSLAAVMKAKLRANVRCMYLNSPPMVAGIRSYLATEGIDVAADSEAGRLVLSSDRGYLADGIFVPATMLRVLEDTIVQALDDGYAGLWASGDMTWEFGPSADFSRLLEYELGLERLFGKYAELSGICQYHTDLLPHAALLDGLTAHSHLFVNDTLSRINPYYMARRLAERDSGGQMDEFVRRLRGESDEG